MKKVMFAAAVAATMFAMGDGIESGIVGYMDITKKGNYSIGGSMFTAPDGASIKLYDIQPVLSGTITKALMKNQYISCLKTTSSNTDRDQTYYYYDGKWYYKFAASDGSSWAADEVVPESKTFPAGTAFLCVFGQAKFTGLQYAGHVNMGEEGYITWTKPGNYSFAVNPLPRDIKLSEITPVLTGSITKALMKNQYISFLKTTSSNTDRDQTYYYYDGKWYHKFAASDGSSWAADEEAPANEITLKVGEGVLCVFGQAKFTGLRFPAPVVQ